VNSTDAVAGTAVVYVHGLWMMGHEALLLQRRLRAGRGYRLHVFHYGSVRQSLEQIVRALRDRLARIEEPQVHLLGHSLGGLIILECLRRYPMAQWGRVVFLGAPVMGSRIAARLGRLGLARAVLGRAVCEELLAPRERRWTLPRELGVIAGTLPLGLGQLVTRFGAQANDGSIAVSETKIPGATAHLALPVSHMGLLLSARVARETGSFLEYGRFGL
jgi:pimeloyl-ACP methyl ester carboxylesterase